MFRTFNFDLSNFRCNIFSNSINLLRLWLVEEKKRKNVNVIQLTEVPFMSAVED